MSKTSIMEKAVKPTKEQKKDAKRKRSEAVDEIEIDVSLPEPPSKKAKRREKKGKPPLPKAESSEEDEKKDPKQQKHDATTPAKQTTSDSAATQKRSEHGIWIGNLRFSVTRDSLRNFLKDEGGISGEEIVRLHLPGPKKEGGQKPMDQHNRGFAYIDFTTEDVMKRAIALSEEPLDGRNVLIKNAKSFEGRPEKQAQQSENGAEQGVKREATKRVFIGNLDFETTKEDVAELFAPAGNVEDVFLATFEDSGKCKGFGWVTFGSGDAAEAAVKGFIYRDVEDDGLEESDVEIITEKKVKVQKEKVWMNRLGGRQLRCEFAEDAQTRYRKRYGKDKNVVASGEQADGKEGDAVDVTARTAKQDPTHSKSVIRPKGDKEERREERRKRHDARTIAPGKALANTQRATGAIVAGSGKKLQFD